MSEKHSITISQPDPNLPAVPQRSGQVVQRVAGHVEGSEAREQAQGVRQRAQLVGAQVERPQVGQASQGVRDGLQGWHGFRNGCETFVGSQSKSFDQ
jgi:hypothetical protein